MQRNTVFCLPSHETRTIKLHSHIKYIWLHYFYFKLFMKQELKLFVSSSVTRFITLIQWQNKTTEAMEYKSTLEARKLSQKHN